MGIELAKAHVTIRADTKRMRGDLAAARGQVRAAVGRMAADAARVGQSWNRAVGSIGAASTRMGLIAAAAGGFILKTFADFELQMIEVGAVTETLATKDFPRLEAAARKAGATTQFTATESAGAMQQLGLAGLKTTEIIGALPGTLELASAASIDIATAADIATGQMKSFNLEASDLSRVNDALIKTQSSSKTNVLELGGAFAKVGSLAQKAGFSMEFTAAILGKMADGMTKGVEAGTALRGNIRALLNPTGDAIKILKEMEVNTLSPLKDQYRELGDALNKIEDPQQRLAKAMKIFGRFAKPFLDSLKEGVTGLESFEKAILDAGGIAKEISDAKINSLTGQLKILRSMLDDVFLTIGKDLNPVFRDLIAELQTLVSTNAADIANALAEGLSAMALGLRDAFVAAGSFFPALKVGAKFAADFLKPLLDFVKENPKILGALVILKAGGFLGLNQVIGTTVIALATTLPAAISVVSTLITTVLIPKLTALGLALGISTGGATLLVGAVIAAVAAIGVFIAKNDTLRGLLMDIGGTIMAAYIEILSSLKPFIDEVAGAFGRLFDALKPLVDVMLDALLGLFQALLPVAVELGKVGLLPLKAAFTALAFGIDVAVVAAEALVAALRALKILGPEIDKAKQRLVGGKGLKDERRKKEDAQMLQGAEIALAFAFGGVVKQQESKAIPALATTSPLGVPDSSSDSKGLLSPGRSGFAEFGANIQDALLKKGKSDLDQNRNTLLAKQVDQNDMIISAIQEQGAGGLA